MVVPHDKREEYIGLDLLGGRLQFEDRRRLIESFYDFMVKEIETRYQDRYPITRKQFVESLVPDYTKYLVDIVIRICESPRRWVPAPRLLDIISFDSILGGEAPEFELGLIGLPTVALDDVIESLKHILAFADRAKLLTTHLRNHIQRIA